MFANIFSDSYPEIVNKLPQTVFNPCVSNFDVPYLSEEERECVRKMTEKYLYSIDHTMLYFSSRIME